MDRLKFLALTVAQKEIELKRWVRFLKINRKDLLTSWQLVLLKMAANSKSLIK